MFDLCEFCKSVSPHNDGSIPLNLFHFIFKKNNQKIIPCFLFLKMFPLIPKKIALFKKPASVT